MQLFHIIVKDPGKGFLEVPCTFFQIESSDAEGRVILDNTSSSSDSGLEQSSSADELENIG